MTEETIQQEPPGPREDRPHKDPGKCSWQTQPELFLAASDPSQQAPCPFLNDPHKGGPSPRLNELNQSAWLLEWTCDGAL